MIDNDYSFTVDGEDGKLNLYVSELINKEGEYILGEVDEETYSKIPQVREAIEKIWINNNK